MPKRSKNILAEAVELPPVERAELVEHGPGPSFIVAP